MTTEREQLGLAAKACDIEIDHWRGGMPMVIIWEYGIGECRAWKPKHDDGDCARMEARLGIDLIWYTTKIQTVDTTGNYRATAFFEDHNGDKNAARRAASLAVATEIGRALRAALGEKP